MAKLNRVTAKIFGETASTVNIPKEIGQFGSAKAGTYNATGDVATIQSLPAWSNGWIDAVTPTDQFPPLPEMTGVHKVLSYQNAYLLQQGIPEWDSATTYYTNNFCSKAGKIYISQSDNNLNNDPASDTVNWKVFESGGARNIGEIVSSTIPLTDAGLHLLDGALLAYGSYSTFIDHIADLYDSGDYTAIFETEANWQTSVTNFGACEKFVYDSVNNTVRLPKTNLVHGPLINSYSNGYSWYRLYSDGWCEQGGVATENISTPLILPYKNTNYSLLLSYAYLDTLDYSISLRTKNIDSFVFAIHGDTTGTGTAYWRASGYTNYVSAERYSYIVIATTTKTNIQVDIDEIATDLNGKADVDLTNINNTGKIAIAHNAMPSDTYDDLTLGASGSTYIAPADGWFYLAKIAGSDFAFTNIILMINSTDSLFGDFADAYRTSFCTSRVEVKKGDVVKIDYNATGATIDFRFIYAQGSESEAQ